MKSGRKPTANPRIVTISFKVSSKEKNKLRGLARIYTRSDVSELIRMRVFEYEDVKPVRRAGC